MVRPPPDGEIEAKPQPDEVVVFRDFFIAGLRFPLDPVVVEIFKLFDVYTHQKMPTSFVWLNLYMWLSKTYKLKPSATGFARLFRCHYQPKTVFVKTSKDAEAIEADPPVRCVYLRVSQPTAEPCRCVPQQVGRVADDVVLSQGCPRWIIWDSSSGGEGDWFSSGAASVCGG